MKHSSEKITFGDFQTPLDLATQCCQVADNQFSKFDHVIEPTCGQGAFVIAAAKCFPGCDIVGYEINDAYRRQARKGIRSAVPTGNPPTIKKQDFFAADWQHVRDRLQGRVLFLGNPPWVTNSQLGVLGKKNLPTKSNIESIRGIDAMTGRSNFDISESILQSLLSVMQSGRDHLAMLVKTATARKVLRMQWQSGKNFTHASLHRIDAKASFGVNVDACLLLLSPSSSSKTSTQVCLQSPSLGDRATGVALGWHDNRLVSDPSKAKATAFLSQPRAMPWRSGLKHDVARIVELTEIDGKLVRKDGAHVNIERDRVYPLAKGADVANDRTDCKQRRILVTQRRMNEATAGLKKESTRTFRYLQQNTDAFASRKSSIYRGRDPFALFGVGDYTFAPWKLAICGLYKRLQFSVLGPVQGRPVIIDDTCYSLGFETQEQAVFAKELCDAPIATEFFQSRIFWDSKRPITAELLRSLNLQRLSKHLKREKEYLRLMNSTDKFANVPID